MSREGLDDFLELSVRAGDPGPADAAGGSGHVAQAGRAAVRERQRAVSAEPARRGDPDRLDQRHRRGHARRADQEGRRLARARDDVPRGRGPRRVERRQRAGDVVLHDQRRGRVADRAPARPEGAGPVQGDPGALGGPHGGRLAVVRQRGQAQGLRRALRVPGQAVAVLPRLERPDDQRAGHDAVPARGGQHAPVHQRAADPPERAEGQGAAVHRRLAAVPAVERGRVGSVGGGQARDRGPDPVPADRRPQAGPRRLLVDRRARRRWARSRPCARTTRRTSCSRT